MKHVESNVRFEFDELQLSYSFWLWSILSLGVSYKLLMMKLNVLPVSGLIENCASILSLTLHTKKARFRSKLKSIILVGNSAFRLVFTEKLFRIESYAHCVYWYICFEYWNWTHIQIFWTNYHSCGIFHSRYNVCMRSRMFISTQLKSNRSFITHSTTHFRTIQTTSWTFVQNIWASLQFSIFWTNVSIHYTIFYQRDIVTILQQILSLKKNVAHTFENFQTIRWK